MGFLLSVILIGSCELKPPFDIAGDLDTPVSAFMKLGRLRAALPAGERRGRRAAGALLLHRLRRRPGGAARSRRACRSARERCPVPADERGAARRAARRAARARRSRSPTSPACRSPAAWSAMRPTTWCATSSACRRARRAPSGVPALHYVAPRSLLVFDHLTRGIALLHAGTEDERQRAAQGSDPGAARRRCPTAAAPGSYSPPRRPTRRDDYMARRAGARRNTSPPATSTSWCCRRASRAGTSSIRSRPIARCASSIPLPTCTTARSGDVTVVGSSPEALVKLNGGRAQLRPIAGTRPRADDAAVDAAREAELLADPEGKRRARHARRSGAQRPRPRRAAPAACASSRTARSSATATSCTS